MASQMDGQAVCGGSVSHERPARVGGLARTGGVGRDGLILELADGADGFEDFRGGASVWL